MSLRSLYEAYKESTKYPLDWLWSQSRATSSQPHTRFQSTSEIINAARTIRQQGIPVPSSVIAKLGDAIKKRREALTLYRSSTDSNNEGDASHEAFVERLEQVRNILSPLKAVAVRRTTAELSSRSGSGTINRFVNLRAALGEAQEEGQDAQAAVAEGVLHDVVPPPANPVLEDDDLGQWIELSLFIYEMDTILECVDKYWEEAARGNMSITMAAALSTVALHAVDRISTRHAQLVPDATVFIDKWMALKPKNPKIRFTDMPDFICQIGANTSLPDDFQQDDLALDTMQESMRELLQTERAIAALEASQDDTHICEPLLPFLRRITADTATSIPIALVFGMEMLLSSFKAFMWPDYTLNRTNCRIEVLKFARDVKHDMTTTAEAIDANTNSKDVLSIKSLLLRERANDLNQVIKEKRFDLYYQAPWTAGSHMNEILDVARYEGVDLCFRTGYLCAVLHLYNALRALPEPISLIPPLERFCHTFKDSLFLGSLPKENFSSHYRRATGMGFGRNEETGKVDYSRLSVTGRDERKMPPMHLCLFTELHNRYYQPDISFWTTVYSADARQRLTRSQRQSAIDKLHSRSFNVALDEMKRAVLPNFRDDLSLARLNICAVFRFCLKLLQGLGASVREQPSTKTDTANVTEVTLGYLYVDLLLESIVERLRDDNRRPLIRYWRQLNVAKDVVTNIGSGVKYAEFLWTL